MVERVQAVRLVRRQIRALKGWAVMGREKVPEAVDFTLSRKAASETVGARTANRHR